ncbi:MAG: hypothetical protein QGH45_23575 [Myxococcota bacterium]|jgi:hypothetical protein|nr:hypothetical protein [Myxococcota bacterium]
MRHRWIPLLSLISLQLGCWMGNPYNPIEFCFETDIPPPIEEDGRTIHHHTAHLLSESWNDEAQPPVGNCGAPDSDRELPEWIFEMVDDEGGTTRFGWTLPEMERPIDKDEDDIITILLAEQHDPPSFGFVIYQGDCPYGDAIGCSIEAALDDGVGGPVLEPDWIPTFEIERTDKVARRNGDCGKQDYHQMTVRGGGETVAISPGQVDDLMVEEPDDHVRYFATNVDNHVWGIDECDGASERFSYVLMRGE